jgi:hypothetical protein
MMERGGGRGQGLYERVVATGMWCRIRVCRLSLGWGGTDDL